MHIFFRAWSNSKCFTCFFIFNETQFACSWTYLIISFVEENEREKLQIWVLMQLELILQHLRAAFFLNKKSYHDSYCSAFSQNTDNYFAEFPLINRGTEFSVPSLMITYISFDISWENFLIEQALHNANHHSSLTCLLTSWFAILNYTTVLLPFFYRCLLISFT